MYAWQYYLLVIQCQIDMACGFAAMPLRNHMIWLSRMLLLIINLNWEKQKLLGRAKIVIFTSALGLFIGLCTFKVFILTVIVLHISAIVSAISRCIITL